MTALSRMPLAIERVVHDPARPEEHPSLDVVVRTIDPMIVELRQGEDRIVMPWEHARRVIAAIDAQHPVGAVE